MPTFTANGTGRTGSIQSWTPTPGLYHVTVRGAQGSTGQGTRGTRGGYGVVISGTVELTGDPVSILVGQQGTVGPYQGNTTYDGAGTGGGGTFIAQSGAPLIVAGGGSGANDYYSSVGLDAKTHTRGGQRRGSNGADSTSSPSTSSVLSQGGYQSYNQSGAGFRGNGLGGGTNALAFTNGGTGAVPASWNVDEEPQGGFGGGSTGNYAHGGTGAGGGYTGGESCSASGNYVGGGGGSFIASSVTNVATSDGQFGTVGTEPDTPYSGAVSNLNEWNEGDGLVTFEPAIELDETLPVPTDVRLGDSFLLSPQLLADVVLDTRSVYVEFEVDKIYTSALITTSGVASIVTDTLPQSTTYQIRARAIDETTGNYGNWSIVLTYSVPTYSIETESALNVSGSTLQAMIDEGVLTPGETYLVRAKIVDEFDAEGEYSAFLEFTVPNKISTIESIFGISGSTLEAQDSGDALAPDTSYRVRAKAVDDSDAESGWSDFTEFHMPILYLDVTGPLGNVPRLDEYLHEGLFGTDPEYRLRAKATDDGGEVSDWSELVIFQGGEKYTLDVVAILSPSGAMARIASAFRALAGGLSSSATVASSRIQPKSLRGSLGASLDWDSVATYDEGTYDESLDGPPMSGDVQWYMSFVRIYVGAVIDFLGGLDGSRRIGQTSTSTLSIVAEIARAPKKALGASLSGLGSMTSSIRAKIDSIVGFAASLTPIALFRKSVQGVSEFGSVIVRRPKAMLGAVVSWPGSLVRRPARALTGAINPMKNISIMMIRGISAAIDFAADMVGKAKPSISRLLPFSGDTSKSTRVSQQGVVSPSPILNRAMTWARGAVLNPIGDSSRRLFQPLSGTLIITTISSQIKKMYAYLAGIISPSAGRTLTFPKKAIDTYLDFSSPIATFTRRAFGGITYLDGAMSKRPRLDKFASLDASGEHIPRAGKALQATIGAISNLVRAPRAMMSATLDITSQFTGFIRKKIVRTLVASGQIVRVAGRKLRAVVNIWSKEWRSVSKPLSATISTAGAIKRGASKALGRVLPSFGNLSRRSRMPLGGSISPVVQKARKTIRSISGALTINAVREKTTSVFREGSLSSSGAPWRIVSMAFEAVLDIASTTSRRARKVVTGQVSPSAVLERASFLFRKALTKTLSLAGTTTRKLSRALDAASLGFFGFFYPTRLREIAGSLTSYSLDLIRRLYNWYAESRKFDPYPYSGTKDSPGESQSGTATEPGWTKDSAGRWHKDGQPGSSATSQQISRSESIDAASQSSSRSRNGQSGGGTRSTRKSAGSTGSRWGKGGGTRRRF